MSDCKHDNDIASAYYRRMEEDAEIALEALREAVENNHGPFMITRLAQLWVEKIKWTEK